MSLTAWFSEFRSKSAAQKITSIIALDTTIIGGKVHSKHGTLLVYGEVDAEFSFEKVEASALIIEGEVRSKHCIHIRTLHIKPGGRVTLAEGATLYVGNAIIEGAFTGALNYSKSLRVEPTAAIKGVVSFTKASIDQLMAETHEDQK